MTPDTILKLLRVRAVEEADTQGERLGWQERDHATREALLLTGDPGKVSSSDRVTDSQWQFLAARADLLAQSADGVVGLIPVPIHTGRWGVGLCLGAFLIGWLSHAMGLSRSFDLIAGPFVLVLLWNTVVYALLVGHLFHGARGQEGRGFLVTLVEKRMAAAAGKCANGKAAEFYLKSVKVWLQGWILPTTVSWFHAGSACFTLGLLAAIYFRGLYTGYLAGWDSTWLNASGVSTVLGFLLDPASRITGIPLPDSLESWNLLKRTSGESGVEAGPWIHLYAVTLFLWVIVPRSVLSLTASIQARRRKSAPPPWQPREPYLRRILSLTRQDGDIGIAILPFDFKSPGTLATGGYQDAIERLLREAWGAGARSCWLKCAAYGSEDSAWEGPWADARKCGGALLVFDGHATPEDEVHGLAVDEVLKHFSDAPGGVMVAVECQNFTPSRLDGRISLWQQFAQKHGCKLIAMEQGMPRDPAVIPASVIFRIT